MRMAKANRRKMRRHCIAPAKPQNHQKTSRGKMTKEINIEIPQPPPILEQDNWIALCMIAQALGLGMIDIIVGLLPIVDKIHTEAFNQGVAAGAECVFKSIINANKYDEITQSANDISPIPGKRELQKYAWWINVDVDIHCVCGEYIQISRETKDEALTCENCGASFATTITTSRRE